MAEPSIRRLRCFGHFLFLEFSVSLIFVLAVNIPFARAEDLIEKKTINDQATDGEPPQRWVVVPVVARTPEMGWLGGALLIHFFPADRPDQRSSSIDLISFGTTHKQFLIALAPKFYISSDRYRIQPSVSWLNWKSNYYGIGSGTPDDA